MAEVARTYFDSKADEATISVGDVGVDGTVMDDGWQNGSVTVVADDALSPPGPRSKAMRFDSGVTAGNASRGYDSNLGSGQLFACLFPFRFDTNPLSNQVICNYYDTGDTIKTQLRVTTGRVLNLRLGFSSLYTGTHTLLADTWYFIGKKVFANDTTGYMEAKLWSATGTLLDTVGNQTGNINTGSLAINRIVAGVVDGAPANSNTWIGGDLVVDDADYPSLPQIGDLPLLIFNGA